MPENKKIMEVSMLNPLAFVPDESIVEGTFGLEGCRCVGGSGQGARGCLCGTNDGGGSSVA